MHQSTDHTRHTFDEVSHTHHAAPEVDKYKNLKIGLVAALFVAAGVVFYFTVLGGEKEILGDEKAAAAVEKGENGGAMIKDEKSGKVVETMQNRKRPK